MKTIATLTTGICLLCLTIFDSEAQQIDVGLFHAGDSTLEVRLRPSDTVAALPLSNVVFTLRWREVYGVSLGNPSSPVYAVGKQGAEQVSGLYRYQKFAAATAQTVSWTANSEISVMTVPVMQTSSGSGTFELVNDAWSAANNGAYYAEMSGLDLTGIVYQGDAANVPLPVRLLSLSAEWKAGAVVLSWLTEGIDHEFAFEIERLSTHDWHSIGAVRGSERNLDGKYAFTDPAPVPSGGSDFIRYRLRMIGADGTASCSPVVEIRYADRSSPELRLMVHPNPVAGIAGASFSLKAPEFISLSISDAVGAAVRSYVAGREFPAGAHSLEVNVAGLRPGVYFLRLYGLSSHAVARFVVLAGH